jgi:hypothetical protein
VRQLDEGAAGVALWITAVCRYDPVEQSREGPDYYQRGTVDISTQHGESAGGAMSGEVAVASSQPGAGDLAHDAPQERIPVPRPQPGSVVNEPALANELDLGRTPVREAIARPAADRFSTDFPRRGADVTPVSLESAFGMFGGREAIECDVTHIAARRVTRHDLAPPPRQAGAVRVRDRPRDVPPR